MIELPKKISCDASQKGLGAVLQQLHGNEWRPVALCIKVDGYSKNKGRKNYRNHSANNEPFTIPKSLDIQLEPAKVQAIDLILMKFYPEFQWLVDFAFCALFIYIPTEAYYTLMHPKNEYNLSMMWAILVVGFCLKVLFSLTAMYFSKDGGGEWVICVVLGLFFFVFVFAMVILIVNDDILEFELDAAYRNFSAGAKVMLARQGIDQCIRRPTTRRCRLIRRRSRRLVSSPSLRSLLYDSLSPGHTCNITSIWRARSSYD